MLALSVHTLIARVLTFLYCKVIFSHYAFATEVARIFLQTFEEGFRSLVFFLMMNFFIKMSSKLLKNRQRWLTVYKTLWRVALILFIVVELFVIIEVAKDRIIDTTLCNNSTYLFMQLSNTLLQVAFVILGFFINKRVQEQNEAENLYEIVFR